MDRSTALRLGIAGVVAGAGLSVGGLAIASAEDNGTDSSSTSQRDVGPRGMHGDMDGGMRGGMFGGMFGDRLETMAEDLGVSEDKLSDALRSVMEDLRPERTDEERPSPPTDAEREAQQAKLVTALAKELGISDAKVEDAFAELEKDAEAERAERRTEARGELSDRLDDAVEDGTLSEDDKASVLKAYDAEVIGGFGGHMGGGPFGR